MRKSKKTAITVAVILIAVGLFISCGAMAAMNFNIKKMNSINFTTNTYPINQTFDNISIEGAECDVRLFLTDDGTCKVICNESDKISHSVAVKDNTLTVERTDNRKWYEHIGIYWGRMEIAVYLPESEFQSLYVLSVSGDIEIPDGFSFAEAEVNNTSGNVDFFADVKNDLSVKTVSGELNVGNTNPKSLDVSSVSGDITVGSLVLGADIKAETVSGDIEITDVKCLNAVAESSSGEIIFKKVIASGETNIGSTSGDVQLLGCDADSLRIKTTSGDVEGNLLTDKTFITDTASGDVHVPHCVGGKCEVKTTSGDIEFRVG